MYIYIYTQLKGGVSMSTAVLNYHLSALVTVKCQSSNLGDDILSVKKLEK